MAWNIFQCHPEVADMDCLDEVIPTVQGINPAMNMSLRSAKKSTRRLENSAKNTCLLPVVLNFGSASFMSNGRDQEYVQEEEEEKEMQEFFINTNNNNNKTRKADQNLTPAKRKFTVRHSRDHLVAERRRRQKMTQHLISLAALLPHLKRMDKSSILGEAVEYVKQLQERVEVLEADNARNVEESSLVEFEEDNISCCGDNNEEIHRSKQGQLPEIEARLCNENVVVRIQCERQVAILVKILSALEKLRLSIITVHAFPFGEKNSGITIITQVGHNLAFTSQTVYILLSQTQ
uniref:BHLH domain-containing protein n=1 Tax=Opuntia streptacantha TaxID=393608 RepID=A0A7C9E2U4_OPUST